MRSRSAVTSTSEARGKEVIYVKFIAVIIVVSLLVGILIGKVLKRGSGDDEWGVLRMFRKMRLR